jgi:hypothetical protein
MCFWGMQRVGVLVHERLGFGVWVSRLIVLFWGGI